MNLSKINNQKNIWTLPPNIIGMLRISSIMDICEYVEPICIANAAIVMFALNQEERPLKISEIIRVIAKETKGQQVLRDESVRNALRKLESLDVVRSKTEPWGEKRTTTRYRLTQKAEVIIKAMQAFCDEVRKQI